MRERFLLVTHEHPDGDALGSLVAMHELLVALGKDAVMFMAAEELPLPYEYRFFSLRGLVTEPPADIGQRTVIFLDCGNIDRNPADALQCERAHILNIDHHHDNTLFGTVNHVVAEASCTAEIVWDLMRGLGVAPTPSIAEALYVGLVTDTGKFMYENTGTRAHEMAAELIEAGVDVHEIYRRIYEGIPYGKLELLARGLAQHRALRRRLPDADAAGAPRTSRETGAQENYSEGVIDHLRSIEGTAVAALVRDRLGAARGHAQGLAARQRRPRRRLGDRPRAGRRRAPPGSRLLDRRCRGRSWSSSCASARAAARSSSPYDQPASARLTAALRAAQGLDGR